MIGRFGAAIVALAFFFVSSPALAQSRIALVIGNSTYPASPLKTTIADAGIVAETLRAAGFDVAELTNVRQADIGTAMRAFLEKRPAQFKGK